MLNIPRNSVNGAGIVVDRPTTAPLLERITVPSDHPNTSMISYKVTFFTAHGETLAGPESEKICLDPLHSVYLSNIPTSPHHSVVARGIYRGRSNFYFVGRIPNNIDTTFIDSFRVSDTSEPLISTTDTCHNIVGYLRCNAPIINTDEVRELWASPQIAQAGARQLYYGINQITRAQNNGDSVKLPIACVRDDGLYVRVVNKTPFHISIYPAEDQRIDNDPPNRAIQLAPKSSAEFKMQNNKWRQTL